MRAAAGAGSPEDLRGKLPPGLTAGMLGSEGLLTRFPMVIPELCLYAFLMLGAMEALPLIGGRPEPAETEKDLVSGECWTR